ncbi:hypothetical protein [Micromonospora tulbaghiae]|uniref:hypothetical protein n=1 Tax=Micromonospora tulbaghiae TaxID=479978 RepID=UPI003EC0B726
MPLHQIRIYHNTESRFMPYDDGHWLTGAVSLGRDLPAGTAPEQIADWAFRVFNADLDHLERDRREPGGEISFLIACVYRLLRLRSLSVGDVIAVATDRESRWLACEPFGWRRITPPSNVHGRLLTAETVYQHIATQAGR